VQSKAKTTKKHNLLKESEVTLVLPLLLLAAQT